MGTTRLHSMVMLGYIPRCKHQYGESLAITPTGRFRGSHNPHLWVEGSACLGSDKKECRRIRCLGFICCCSPEPC